MKTMRFFLHPDRRKCNWAACLLTFLVVAVIFLPQSAAGQHPVVPKLTLSQVEQLVSNKVPDSTLSSQIQKRGLAFAPIPAIVESLRAKGAGPLTLEAIEALFPKGTQGTVTARTQLTLGAGFSRPSGVAVDESENVFVADTVNGAVKEILATGGYTEVRTLASGLGQVSNVATDRFSNVFFADPINGGVKEILAIGGYTTVKTLSGGFGHYCRVTVDRSGNVFVADIENKALKEILAAGGYTTVRTLSGGFGQYGSLAVDRSGNIFVVESGNNSVKEILAVSGYATVKILGSGFSHPVDVAVDGRGNVFVASIDNYSGPPNNTVKEILAAGGYITVIPFATGFSYPVGVAVDGSGNVFVADAYKDQVVELKIAGPNATPDAVTQLTDNGASLAATMQFIQDKMNERDQMKWVLTMSLVPGVIRRDTYTLVHSDISVDSATCTLRSTETTEESTVRSTDATTGSAPQWNRSVATQSFSFKDINTIAIGSPADIWNSRFAKGGHPEKTATLEPTVFDVIASGPKPAISFHNSVSRGDNQALPVVDQTLTAARFTFRDEDMANRIVKAMRHAIELCSSGNKEPF